MAVFFIPKGRERGYFLVIETKDLPIRQSSEAYIFRYPEPAELAQKQASIFWNAAEINVDGDKNDFLFNMSYAEQEAVKTTLKLFTMYEVLLNEAWGSKIYHWFPRPETQMMSSIFAAMEAAVHAVFYSNLNKTLMIDDESFYLSYKNDEVLSERIKDVNEALNSENVLLALAAFTLLENVVLYSNFAFLAHYQANGKNMINNVVSGIKFSANDESIHALGAAWLFNQTLAEYKETVDEETYKRESEELFDQIYDLAGHLCQHEQRIVDILFENGPIEGIAGRDIKIFVRDRVNMTLSNLNLEKIYKVEENPVADWFYNTINGLGLHDFFSKQGNGYTRSVGEGDFDF